ncbi:unnamed protein product [Rotaria sp. Silwood2]|nr:unnamed protein product [Rotaria sp. Silwood2]
MRRITLRLILSAIGICICCILLVFIVSNFSNNIYEIESKSAKCNCPPTKNSFPQIIPSESSITRIETILKPCEEIQKSSPVQRAILIYYPHHQSEYFFPEVRWLYRSWVEMLLDQPPTWRTDFVIFTYNFSTEFRKLGCVNRIRQDKEEPSICRLFLYVPIQFRTKNITDNSFQHAFDDAKRVMASYKDMNGSFISVPLVNDKETFDGKRSESLYENLRSYGYIDSINTIYEGYWTFKMYDFVLRTDIGKFTIFD